MRMYHHLWYYDDDSLGLLIAYMARAVRSHQSSNKLVQAQFKQFILYALAALVLDGGEGVLDHCKVTHVSSAPTTASALPRQSNNG